MVVWVWVRRNNFLFLSVFLSKRRKKSQGTDCKAFSINQKMMRMLPSAPCITLLIMLLTHPSSGFQGTSFPGSKDTKSMGMPGWRPSQICRPDKLVPFANGASYRNVMCTQRYVPLKYSIHHRGDERSCSVSMFKSDVTYFRVKPHNVTGLVHASEGARTMVWPREMN